MYSKVRCVGLKGMEGFEVGVEANITGGLPCMDFVGALGTEVKEAKERVKAALNYIGVSLPPKRITVNLSPGQIRKEGCAYDLAIACALMQAIGLMEPLPDDVITLGELGLDGSLRPINGVLPLLIFAKDKGFSSCLIPSENACEASLVEGMRILPVNTLSEVEDIIKAPDRHYFKDKPIQPSPTEIKKDFGDILGQESLKRAILIAAAGMHNILMTGPPGSGKTMSAERIPDILPDLTDEEKLELTKIYSICGKLDRKSPQIVKRPFRFVHQRTTLSALLGGGRIPTPGEISLAHRGVLFLDEAPEFPRASLEALRQPLESGEIFVNRLYGVCRFPARIMLVAARNPCPCGYFPDRSRCHCTAAQIEKYNRKISTPLLDRIDIKIDVPRVSYESLSVYGKDFTIDRRSSVTSRQMKDIVTEAAERQRFRYKNEDFSFNSRLPAGRIAQYCKTDSASEKLLRQAYDVLGLSARGFHRVLKTALTVADVDGSQIIRPEHLSEALSYRQETKYEI